MTKYTAVDIETTGLNFNTDTILGVGYGEEYVVRPSSISVPGPLTAHNHKFEAKFFKKFGVKADIQFDTLLAASILIDRPDKLDLASVASHYLGWESWKSDTDKLFKKKNWVQLLEADPILQKALKDRNIYDLKATGVLTETLSKKLTQEDMTSFFHDKIMPAARLLADVEYRGMRIDLGAVKKKTEEVKAEIETLYRQLNEWAAPLEINWNSPKQLLVFLKSRGYSLWIYDFKKKTTVESTGVDALEKLLPNPNIELLLKYRGATKMLGYLEGWLEENYEERLYPTYNLASTRTGRLSCSNPNLQQVPRDPTIRGLFVPSPGKVFVIADYSQVEPRVAAHYSQDEALLNVFKEGLDFYGSIANRVLGVECHPNKVKELHPKERKVSKEIGLSILYGIGGDKLSSIIKKKAGILIDPSDCKNIIKDYFKAYPGLLEFRKYIERKVMNDEILYTHYGRQFKIDPDKVFSTGVNTIVQSTASDACLFSQLQVAEELKSYRINADLVAIVHDEVIYECDEKYAADVGVLMEKIMINQGLRCPLKLDWAVGMSWGDKS